MKTKRYIRYIISLLLVLCLSAQGIFASADNGSSSVGAADSALTSRDYSAYASGNAGVPAATEIITVKGADYTNCADGKFTVSDSDKSGVLTWEDGNGTVSYDFIVPSDSLYNVYLTYIPTNKNAIQLRFGLKLDGNYCCEDFEELSFPTVWNNESEDFYEDSFGNQLTPKQVMSDEYVSCAVKDDSGVVIKPYELRLTAGKHTLSLVGFGEGVQLKSVSLTPPESEPSYKDYIGLHKNSDSDGAQTVVLEGENAVNKTSFSLIPQSDSLDASTSPSDPTRTMLNYIGGSTWLSAGESVSWRFNAEKSGFYKLTFRYKQSQNVNRSSYRHLTVDGATPFSEAREIEFKYSSKWDYMEYSDGESPYLIWLDKGEHTLSLEVTLGEKNAEYYTRLNEILKGLNSIYLNIIKITSASPDVSRDYDLFNQIPDLNDSLTKHHSLLTDLTAQFKADDGGKTSEISAAFENMARVLKNMIKSPYRAQDYISNYYSAYSSLSTWLQDMKEMPLSIDYVTVAPENASETYKKVSFFGKIKYSVTRFLSSFTRDYESLSGAENEDAITVWTTAGRDQSSALSVLIKQDFTEKTGIQVNLKVVSASLINGLMSDQYPDVMIGKTRSDPVNYGVRNALYDLKQFDDYDEVIKRFQPGAEVPYTYNNVCYALPETQSFFTMFYRTDILKELNLEVPKTWDEFLEASVSIQRNNMEVYIPYTRITAATMVNIGIGSMSLFPTLMLQKGNPFYNDSLTATTLTTPSALDIFDYWVKMYTDYQIVKEAEFYNRFRMGIMPLGIAPYTTYFNFVEMAPEIQGKYSMALVPSFEADGNSSIAGGGSGCVIINKSEKKEAAWEFLKWYTSDEAQTEYSRQVESKLGLVGRVATANVQALNNLDWDSTQLSVINEQWKRVVEVPEIPGSYYLIRAVDQAFWSVINGEANTKDAVAQWSASADAEIERKYDEFNKQ